MLAGCSSENAAFNDWADALAEEALNENVTANSLATEGLPDSLPLTLACAGWADEGTDQDKAAASLAKLAGEEGIQATPDDARKWLDRNCQ